MLAMTTSEFLLTNMLSSKKVCVTLLDVPIPKDIDMIVVIIF